MRFKAGSRGLGQAKAADSGSMRRLQLAPSLPQAALPARRGPGAVRPQLQSQLRATLAPERPRYVCAAAVLRKHTSAGTCRLLQLPVQ